MVKVMTYRGGQMGYTLQGSGQPLILLHGFGESGSIWHHQVERLAQVCRVIVPDLPGTGSSPMPEGESLDTLEAYADLLDALLDAEGLATCTLIGHSMGGYIALAFAEKYPERLDALGLFHSTALADSEQRKELRKKGIRFMQEYGPAAFLKEVIPGLYAESFRSASPQTIQAHLEESTKWATVEALSAYYRAMMSRPDRTHVLADFKGPVLFILGALDKTVVLEETIPQTRLAQNAQVHVMKNEAHMGMQEDPEQTINILKDFMLGVNQS
jgi:pimeloyl-ACP methyl ester carboxylesterase